MKIRESQAGEVIVVDTPVFHWFVVVLLASMNISLYLLVDASVLAVKIFFGVLLGLFLIQNTQFTIRTHLSSREGKIRTKHVGLFGVRNRVMDFGEVIRCDLQGLNWGRWRHRRYTLSIETYNDIFLVFVSIPPTAGQQAAEKITDILFPELPPPLPDEATVPPGLGDRWPSRLEALCREYSSSSCSFEAIDALGEWRQAAMEKKIAFPKGERVLAFLDTSLTKRGTCGLAVAWGGLYWKNPMGSASRRFWIGWDEFANASVAQDPDDQDIWISPGMQIGFIDPALQEGAYALLLALQKEVHRARSAHHPSG